MKYSKYICVFLCLILSLLSCAKSDETAIPNAFKQDAEWMAYKNASENLEKVEKKIAKKYKYPHESGEYMEADELKKDAREALRRAKYRDYRNASFASGTDSVDFKIILDAFAKINSGSYKDYSYSTDLNNPYDGFYQELEIREWKKDERVSLFAWSVLNSLVDLKKGFSHDDLYIEDINKLDRRIYIEVYGEVVDDEIVINRLELRSSDISRKSSYSNGRIEITLGNEDAKHFLMEVAKYIENNGIAYV